MDWGLGAELGKGDGWGSTVVSNMDARRLRFCMLVRLSAAVFVERNRGRWISKVLPERLNFHVAYARGRALPEGLNFDDMI